MSSAAKKIPETTTAASVQALASGAAQAAILPNIQALRPQAVMPWDVGLNEDKRFKRWLVHGAGVCVTLAVLTFLMPEKELPVAAKKENRQQYAQLVIEEKFIPPPVVEEKPKPVPEKKVEKPKPVPEKKIEKVKQPEPVVKVKKLVKPVEKKPGEAELRAQAREKAANTGLLALSDQLSSLRDQTSTSSVANLKSGGDKATAVKRNVLAAKTNDSLSGGASVSQQAAAGGLGGREQAAVVVSEAAVQAVESTASSSNYQQSRSADEVRRVMDSSKGAIYSVYNRALRKNPTLEGTFGFSMTIEPSGAISNVSLLNSELADPALERRLLARIRMIKFEARDVGVTEVNYSFDFLPY